MNTPLDLDSFVAIVESGSISEAARALGEPRATLSRRLARLEEHFGVRLLHRSTRRLEPTRVGLELYQRGRRIVDEVRAVERALRQLDDVPRGPLRISVPGGPIAGIVGPLVATFLERHPDVVPEIVATDRHVDLVGEGFDAAIRAGRSDDGSLVRRVLGYHRVVAVASPSYLAARGTPETVDELAEHDCIVGFGGGDRPHPVWPLVDGGEVRVRAAVSANDLATLALLACAGRGIACVPEGIALEQIEAGELAHVLPEIGARTELALVYPERRLLEPQVRAFVDHAFEWFGRRPPSCRACGSPAQ